MPFPLSSATTSIPAVVSYVPPREDYFPLPRVRFNIACGLGDYYAQLPLTQFVEVHLAGKRKSLSTSVPSLAWILWVDRDKSIHERHYFHRMAITVVPPPGLVSISNSFINRLLPPRPKPIPEPVVNPSFSA